MYPINILEVLSRAEKYFAGTYPLGNKIMFFVGNENMKALPRVDDEGVLLFRYGMIHGVLVG